MQTFNSEAKNWIDNANLLTLIFVYPLNLLKFDKNIVKVSFLKVRGRSVVVSFFHVLDLHLCYLCLYFNLILWFFMFIKTTISRDDYMTREITNDYFDTVMYAFVNGNISEINPYMYGA